MPCLTRMHRLGVGERRVLGAHGGRVKILFVSQLYTPEPRPPKGVVFAKALQARGHEIEVLTGYPNYPDGKVYKGYRQKLWQRETIDGVPITRVPLYPSHDRSGSKRALTYLSFAFWASLLGPWLMKKPDVIYMYQGPATNGIPANVLRVRFGAPYIMDIQDLWPDTISASGMAKGGRVVKVVGRYMKWLYRKANRIMVLSHGFKRTLVERGVPEEKIHVIYNWAPPTSLVEALPDRDLAKTHGIENTFNIMFAGNMGTVQALDKVVEAAALLEKELPDVRFVFIGSGSERDTLEQLVRTKNLSNVVLLPRVPVDSMPRILALASAMLVHLRDEFPFDVTIPSKTQEALGIGKPVLMAVRGEASELVVQAQAGVIAEPLNPESIAGAARTLRGMSDADLAAMGQRGKAFYEANMSFDIVVDQIEAMLKQVTGGK